MLIRLRIAVTAAVIVGVLAMQATEPPLQTPKRTVEAVPAFKAVPALKAVPIVEDVPPVDQAILVEQVTLVEAVPTIELVPPIEPESSVDQVLSVEAMPSGDQTEFSSSMYVLPDIVTALPMGPIPADVKRGIDSALAGEMGSIEVGDMIGQDFVGIIQATGGSVLKGSVLDPALDSALEPALIGETTVAAEEAVAAEQLLRASRLLEQVGDLDSSRAALVNRMRVEARRLLSE